MGDPVRSAEPGNISTRRVATSGAEPRAPGPAASQPGEPASPGGAAGHGPQHTPLLHQGGAAGKQAALSQQCRGMAAAGHTVAARRQCWRSERRQTGLAGPTCHLLYIHTACVGTGTELRNESL